MIYNDFRELKLPALGFGTMRLPGGGTNTADVDEPATAAMVELALRHGVNYFDTGWGYHEGVSETVMGKVLGAWPRESFFFADKFPGYDKKNFGHIEEIFPEQLKKTGLDYFDFYLFHNVSEMNLSMYLDPQYHVHDYIMERKAEGKIRHVGFSAHCDVEAMKTFIEAYREDLEFCQIQLNWIDWSLQNGKEKVELLNSYGIPIWIMEPLRGGKLVKLNEQQRKKLEEICPGMSPAEAGFRYLRSIPGVTVILSGMSDLEQMQENISIFSEKRCLTKEQFDAMTALGREMAEGVPCTGCSYCTKYCPQHINIPKMIDLYNQRKFTGADDFVAVMSIAGYPKSERPYSCIACGSCAAVCPQKLDIPGIMADFSALLKKK